MNIASRSVLFCDVLSRIGIVATIIFIVAHVVLLLGITVPDKLYFDEVHYVPAAARCCAGAARADLNPMHPPLARRSSRSIKGAWRRAARMALSAALFGALALVAVYLGGLALFASQERAIAAVLLAFFNQMLFKFTASRTS